MYVLLKVQLHQPKTIALKFVYEISSVKKIINNEQQIKECVLTRISFVLIE